MIPTRRAGNAPLGRLGRAPFPLKGIYGLLDADADADAASWPVPPPVRLAPLGYE